MVSSVICVLSYILTVFSPFPILSLIGCAICGFSVGIMWPVHSALQQKAIRGGTALFAILALAGDVGCTSGPGLVGLVSNAVSKIDISAISGWFRNTLDSQIYLKIGILSAMIFPIVLIIGVVFA